MSRIFVAHSVQDYDQWKVAYDADTERRKGLGLTEVAHYHSASDPNHFLIVWDSALSPADTRAVVSGMFSDPELIELMQAGGVIVEEIKYWFADD